MLSWIGDVAWAAALVWIGKNLPGVICLLVGFLGLVVAGWRHVAGGKTGFRLSPRYFRDWLIVIFGGTLCTVGLLIVLGIIEAG